MGQNLVPLVNPKIAGKWMFIPLKMYLYIGIDPYPFHQLTNQLKPFTNDLYGYKWSYHSINGVITALYITGLRAATVRIWPLDSHHRQVLAVRSPDLWPSLGVNHIFLGCDSCDPILMNQTTMLVNQCIFWLVVSTPLKNISHLGWLFPI